MVDKINMVKSQKFNYSKPHLPFEKKMAIDNSVKWIGR